METRIHESMTELTEIKLLQSRIKDITQHLFKLTRNPLVNISHRNVFVEIDGLTEGLENTIKDIKTHLPRLTQNSREKERNKKILEEAERALRALIQKAQPQLDPESPACGEWKETADKIQNIVTINFQD